MRFNIMKYDKIIGHIDFDEMTIPLLRALHELGYRVELEDLT